VDAEVAKLLTAHKKTEEELSLRQKQFKLLMHSIFELQRALDPDMKYADADQDDDEEGAANKTGSLDVEMSVA
jgi:hypothetical protein